MLMNLSLSIYPQRYYQSHKGYEKNRPRFNRFKNPEFYFPQKTHKCHLALPINGLRVLREPFSGKRTETIRYVSGMLR